MKVGFDKWIKCFSLLLMIAAVLLSIPMFSVITLADPSVEGLDARNKSDKSPPASTIGQFSYRTTYYDTDSNKRNWEEGSVTGNGENALIESGNPIDNAMVFQNIKFNYPHPGVREVPRISSVMDAAKQRIVNKVSGNGSGTAVHNLLADEASVWSRGKGLGNWPGNGYSTYSYHPSHKLKLKMGADMYDGVSYLGWTNYQTAEIGTSWKDEYDQAWERISFSSREDNVTITVIRPLEGQTVNMDLYVDNATSMREAGWWADSGPDLNDMRYKKVVDKENASYIGEIAHYPKYDNTELKEAGFAGITRVIAKGGLQTYVPGGSEVSGVFTNKERTINIGTDKNPTIRVEGASEVILITKSDRDLGMGPYSNFTADSEHALLDKLMAETLDVAKKKEYTENGDPQNFNYDKALIPHKEKHGEIFNRVKVDLGASEETRAMTNEELIAAQKASKDELMPAMLERVFYNGRYSLVCSSGIQAPRLNGIWTGEWRPLWNGDYTTNANINLQVAGNNIGAMPEASQGYITLLLKSITDWQINAKAIHGIDNALMAPPRMDGDRATLFHFGGGVLMEGWNAGASWLILPMYEYWQCYGNQHIPITDELRVKLQSTENEYTYRDADYPDDTTDYNLRTTLGLDQDDVDRILRDGYFDLESDILYPLLEKTANFFDGLLSPQYYVSTDGKAVYDANHTELLQGEKFLIVPSYSPENKPSGSDSEIVVNATMDIASTKDMLNMLMTLDKKLYAGVNAEKWELLYHHLPDYIYEPTGELKEWALESIKENYDHRHVSHFYGAWPAYESSNDIQIYNGTVKALETKNKYLDVGTKEAHGWLHKALVAARLKMPDDVSFNLSPLLTNNGIYTSLMMEHNWDRTALFCTDPVNTIPAIVLESLVYSDAGQIELLPALMTETQRSGSLSGVKTRSGGEIKSLEWNEDKVRAVIDAPTEVRLKMSGNISYTKVTVNGIDVTNRVITDTTDFRGLKYIMISNGDRESVTVQYTINPDADPWTTTVTSVDKYQAGKITVNAAVRNNTEVAQEIRLIVAAYDSLGKLISMSEDKKKVQADSSISSAIPLDMSRASGAVSVKMFTWDKESVPLTELILLE